MLRLKVRTSGLEAVSDLAVFELNLNLLRLTEIIVLCDLTARGSG
jgi:hypothetical protein